MNFNISISDDDLFDIIYPNYYLTMNKFIVSLEHTKYIVTKNIDLITRNDADNKNYVLTTLDRCDIILSITDNLIVVGIALLQLSFDHTIYIYGMYTSETNEKKYGTYLMDMIKYMCNNINAKKIILSPIDNVVESFYVKNNFNKNQYDNFYYFNL